MEIRKIRTRYSELVSKIIEARSEEKLRIESEIIGLISLNREYAIEYFSTIISRSMRIKSRAINEKFDSTFLNIVIFKDSTIGVAISVLNKTSQSEEEYASAWLTLLNEIVSARQLSGVIRFIAVNGLLKEEDTAHE